MNKQRVGLVVGLWVRVTVGLGLLLGLYVVPSFTHWVRVPCTVTSGRERMCTETLCNRVGKVTICSPHRYTCCDVDVVLRLDPPEDDTVNHRGSCPSVGSTRTCAFVRGDRDNTLTTDETDVPVLAIVAFVLYGVFWIVCCVVGACLLAKRC
jgi:hypothetical protein